LDRISHAESVCESYFFNKKLYASKGEYSKLYRRQLSSGIQGCMMDGWIDEWVGGWVGAMLVLGMYTVVAHGHRKHTW